MSNSKKIKSIQIKLSASYDEEVIDGMSNMAVKAELEFSNKVKEEILHLNNDPELSEEDKGVIVCGLSDEKYAKEKISSLVYEMQIVALYKTVEIAIKDMLNYSNLFTDKQIASFYMISKLKSEVGKKIKPLDQIKSFEAFDELRCVNNCIKHSGRVNKELSKYKGWSEGSEISDLNSVYEKLKYDVRSFVFDLRDEILNKI